jgi:hypothetical protein
VLKTSTAVTEHNTSNTSAEQHTVIISDTVQQKLGELQNQIKKNLLLTKKATTLKIVLISLEGLLFLSLTVLAFIWAKPVVYKIPNNIGWWLHPTGILFFLCFILQIRRLLLLIPLTMLAFISWEVFSFISSFEKTLDATSVLAKIKVERLFLPQKETELPQVELTISFGEQNKRTVTMLAQQKLYLEGRYYRVSSEVLLFGGRNIATLDRIFSDIIASANGIVLVDKEAIPPQYQWQESKSNINILPKQQMFYWLWKQFFKLQDNKSNNTKYIQLVPLTSVPCAPLFEGQVFEIHLRHVGSLECYVAKQTNNTHAPKKSLQQNVPTIATDDSPTLPQNKMPIKKVYPQP